MNRRIALATLAILLAAVLALAAGTNFSGTWVRDNDKSDQPSFGGRPGGGGPGGGGPGGGRARDMQVTLVLKQADNELLVTRKTTVGGEERPALEQRFTLDGKENTNPAPQMGRRGGGPGGGPGGGGGTPPQIKSKSKWDKNSLVIEGTMKVSTPNGEFDIETKDVYSLSADGKVLTVTTTRTTPQGDNTTKTVYNKK
jgi:hypothetical protein